jgi:membrane-associated phospholipid phosphatase
VTLWPETAPTTPGWSGDGSAPVDSRYPWTPAGTPAPRSRLRPEECLLLVFGLVVAGVALAAGVVPVALGGVLTSPGLSGTLLIGGLLVFLIAYRRAVAAGPDALRLRHAAAQTGDTLRAFVVPLGCVASYATLHDLTPVVGPDLVDAQLIAVDHALLGVDVSRWLNDHIGSAPLTVVMTVCYLTYGSAQAAYALSRYLRGRTREFHDFSLAVAITGVVGYSGYLLVPAVGPHVYQSALFPEPLPGHSGTIGAILDTITTVQGTGRDVFPSLHTAMTVVLLGCAWRDARRWFWWNLPIGLGVILSTMYLRKHYAVDVLAGLVLAGVAVAVAGPINRWWYRGGAPRAAWPTWGASGPDAHRSGPRHRVGSGPGR